MESIKLYSYYRSSASYRVRAALNIKKISFDYMPVHLVQNGGEQNQDSFLELNPMGQVPCLVHKGKILNQSMAIIHYLDGLQPDPPLFPESNFQRSKVIEFCEIINSGIHPLQNLKSMQELERQFGVAKNGRLEWSRYWINNGFKAIERMLQVYAGTYCFGNQLTAADLFLCPQAYNARRFEVDLSRFPLIKKIDKNCLKLDAFCDAYPGVQPDTPDV